MGTAMSTARTREVPTSMTSRGMSLATMASTLRLSLYEKPRLPCTRWSRKTQYWYQSGLFEAVLLVEHGDLHIGRPGADDGPGDTAGDEVLQAEGDHGDPEDHHDGLQQPPDYVTRQLERPIPT